MSNAAQDQTKSLEGPGAYVLWAFVAFSVIVIVGAAWHIDGNPWISLLVGVFGAACGWIIGTILSPWGRSEKTSFTMYRRAAGAFVSGYVLGKADTIIAAITVEALTEPLVINRLLLFFTALVFTAGLVYGMRQYVFQVSRRGIGTGGDVEAPA